MKTFRALLLLILTVCFALIVNGADSVFAISETEADAIIEAEATAQAQREADQRAELLEVPAVRERAFDRSGKRTVFRQVASPIRIGEPPTEKTFTKIANPKEDLPAGSNRKSTNLTLFVTVFNGELTEIRVAPNEEDVTVLSNIAFTHLPGIESVQTEDAYFSFFSFVNRVESDSEGAPNRPDAVILSTAAPDYIAYTESGAAVSPDVTEAIDVLHRHYLEHEPELEAKAERADTLQAARRSHAKENPPAPRETVINFFPIRSQIHSNETE